MDIGAKTKINSKQPPDKESAKNTKTASLKSVRRKRKKTAQKNKIKKQAAKKAKQRFATTMSSWAQNFSAAATWQIKHQAAHWKSKARALEYENKVLRDLLRHYYVHGNASGLNETRAESVKSDSEEESDAEEEEQEEDEQEEELEEDEQQDEENEGALEFSPEFLEYLKSNTEFRKMREERQRLRQLEAEMATKILEEDPQETSIDSKEELQKKYGDHWERIAALEMSTQSKFMSDCDKLKPAYWPNIPLKL